MLNIIAHSGTDINKNSHLYLFRCNTRKVYTI